MSEYLSDEGEYVWSAELERDWAEQTYRHIKLRAAMLAWVAGGFNSKPPKTQRIIDIAKLMYRAERELEAYLNEVPKS